MRINGPMDDVSAAEMLRTQAHEMDIAKQFETFQSAGRALEVSFDKEMRIETHRGFVRMALTFLVEQQWRTYLRQVSEGGDDGALKRMIEYCSLLREADKELRRVTATRVPSAEREPIVEKKQRKTPRGTPGKAAFQGLCLYPHKSRTNPARKGTRRHRMLKIVYDKPGLTYEEYKKKGGLVVDLYPAIDRQQIVALKPGQKP